MADFTMSIYRYLTLIINLQVRYSSVPQLLYMYVSLCTVERIASIPSHTLKHYLPVPSTTVSQAACCLG